MPGPTLLVLADSLAFHGPERAEPADEPRLWPNVAAAALGGRAELVAG
ncbi:MAG TPA: SGNH/GDSL hydrolase family protein, partial [Pseudonocardia sp.]|nr:SGNH/GDSL hydrolase family protein [Pseudonocardia sp.]